MSELLLSATHIGHGLGLGFEITESIKHIKQYFKGDITGADIYQQLAKSVGSYAFGGAIATLVTIAVTAIWSPAGWAAWLCFGIAWAVHHVATHGVKKFME